MKLNVSSDAKLTKVHPDLVKVVRRAAHRLAAIEGRALATAIEARHRGGEALIEGGEILWLDGCLGHGHAVLLELIMKEQLRNCGGAG